MVKVSAVLILILMSFWSYSQNDTLQARLVLIGDAGDFQKGRHPVIDAVRQTIPFNKKTTVLFLGDNLYTKGLPDEQSPEYDIRKSVLDTQIALANGTDAKVILFPAIMTGITGVKTDGKQLYGNNNMWMQKAGKM